MASHDNVNDSETQTRRALLGCEERLLALAQHLVRHAHAVIGDAQHQLVVVRMDRDTNMAVPFVWNGFHRITEQGFDGALQLFSIRQEWRQVVWQLYLDPKALRQGAHCQRVSNDVLERTRR